MKLNVEQRRIVEIEPHGHMMVKGVAGSGKTTVAIRRISFLKNHYTPEPDDKILLVTYNKTLLQYIQHNYEKLVEEEQDYIEDLFASDTEVEIVNIDKLMFRYFYRYCKRQKLRLDIVKSPLMYKVMQQAIQQVQGNYVNKLINLKNSQFLLDEVSWINACLIEDVETYQTIDRTGRSTGTKDMPQKLNKNSEVRQAIFELMQTYNALLLQQGLITFEKMNELALKEVQQSNDVKYTHIIIDESQDLTRIQLQFLRAIYSDKPYSSIFFVADNTQSIYPYSWLGKGRPYTTIGFDMSGKSRILSKNYRTTTEISKAAFNLIERDETIQSNIDFVKPSLIDRHGHPPIYRYFKTTEAQLQFLLDEIDVLKNDYQLGEICIVAKEKRIVDSTAQSLQKAGITCTILQKDEANFDDTSVKLVTMHSIKGLEFKVIFLIDLNEGVIPNNRFFELEDDQSFVSEERKLLYVGMTRANELLYMSSVKKPSRFMKELNFDHLRMKRDCKLRPFQSIALQDYVLQSQIADMNAKEEVVRQWLLRELHKTYNYPLELLELEYGVQQFSRKGYVDVAVNIYVNGEARPYIFAEVKQFGAGIEDATAQLKTYMEATPHVRYGVVTDGLCVVCFDRNGDELQDIPSCQPQFLPQTKNTQLYMNLKNAKKYKVATEMDDADDVEYYDADTNVSMQYEQTYQVPLIGNVAAGVPIEAVEQFEQCLTLPKDWLLTERETFALTVTGDSMIGAGIDKGDIVIVNRQQTAVNNDIIIAIIDGEATMKKFMPMGDSIVLISENDKYEPIMMNKDDVLINGKVIGVLKK